MIKGSEAQKQRPHELLWMLCFDEKSISSCIAIHWWRECVVYFFPVQTRTFIFTCSIAHHSTIYIRAAETAASTKLFQAKLSSKKSAWGPWFFFVKLQQQNVVDITPFGGSDLYCFDGVWYSRSTRTTIECGDS